MLPGFVTFVDGEKTNFKQNNVDRPAEIGDEPTATGIAKVPGYKRGTQFGTIDICWHSWGDKSNPAVMLFSVKTKALKIYRIFKNYPNNKMSSTFCRHIIELSKLDR